MDSVFELAWHIRLPCSIKIRFELSPWEETEWVDRQTLAGREEITLLLPTNSNKNSFVLQKPKCWRGSSSFKFKYFEFYCL